MENNPSENNFKRLSSPKDNPMHKIKKSNVQMASLPQTISKSSPSFARLTEILSVTRDDKMNNIAKLRQQFVEEIKYIVLSLEESKKNLQVKIAEVKKKDELIKQKLRDEHKLICKYNKVILDKEQENKVLRQKVEELYGYQKTIVENLEDINTTLSVHETLSDRLTNDYNSVLVIQQNENRSLREELNKIIPDENFSSELNKINWEINKLDEDIVRYQDEINAINVKINEIKKQKEEDQKKLLDLDKRVHELNSGRIKSKEDADKKKNNLLATMENLKQETNAKAKKVTEMENNIAETNNKLEEARRNFNTTEEKIKNLNNEIISLSKKIEQLDQEQKNQTNTANLEKHQEKLKTSKAQLESIKQNEIQATNVLQNKISELHIKLQSYQDIESKIEKSELEMKGEEETITYITQDCERKKNEYKIKNKSNEDKINDIKTKICQADSNILEFEKIIELLQKEISELNGKYETKLKEINSNTEKSPKSISQYTLPNLFVPEETEATTKQKNRRKLYTPTFTDDELEIDSLTIDEQFNHLTQSSNPSSQPDSPDKQKKFFKRSTSTQSQLKKENTPRGRGRNKKN